MRNRGIELALNAEVVKTKDFSYTANFTFSYENNKLTSLSNDVYKSSYEDQYDLPSPGNPARLTAYKKDSRSRHSSVMYAMVSIRTELGIFAT